MRNQHQNEIQTTNRSKECQVLYPPALDADVCVWAGHYTISLASLVPPSDAGHWPPASTHWGWVPGLSFPPAPGEGEDTLCDSPASAPWHSTVRTNWPGCSSSKLCSSSASTPAPRRPPWRRPATRRTPACSTPSPSSMSPWTGLAPTPPSTPETLSLWPSETQSSFSFFSLPRP